LILRTYGLEEVLNGTSDAILLASQCLCRIPLKQVGPERRWLDITEADSEGLARSWYAASNAFSIPMYDSRERGFLEKASDPCCT
jgi:hypothetical protein